MGSGASPEIFVDDETTFLDFMYPMIRPRAAGCNSRAA